MQNAKTPDLVTNICNEFDWIGDEDPDNFEDMLGEFIAKVPFSNDEL